MAKPRGSTRKLLLRCPRFGIAENSQVQAQANNFVAYANNGVVLDAGYDMKTGRIQ